MQAGKGEGGHDAMDDQQEGTNAAAVSSTTDGSCSVSTIAFGSAPSRVFTDIRSSIDDAISEAVSSLPYLPSAAASSSSATMAGGRAAKRTRRADPSSGPHGAGTGAGGSSSSATGGAAEGEKDGASAAAEVDGDGAEGGQGEGEGEGEGELGGVEKLQRRLRVAYDGNVDICEMFAARNVFSIPRHWRVQLIDALRSGPDGGAEAEVEAEAGFVGAQSSEKASAAGGGNDDAPNVKDDSTESTPAPAALPPLRSKDDVPTNEQIAEVDRELLRLRQGLREAREESRLLTSKFERVSRARSCAEISARGVARALTTQGSSPRPGVDPSGSGRIHEAVIAAVMGKDGLAECRAEGDEMSSKLDEIAAQSEESGPAAVVGGSETASREDSLRDRFASLKKRQIRTEDASGFASILRQR